VLLIIYLVSRYLDIAGIIEPKVVGKLKEMTFSDAPSRAKRIVPNDSLVLSMVRPYQKSFVYLPNGEGIIASTGTSVVCVNNKELTKFVFHQFFSKKFSKFCEDRMSGTNYPAITPADIKQYKIAIPIKLKKVKGITDRLDSFDNAIECLKAQISSAKSLKTSIINQIF